MKTTHLIALFAVLWAWDRYNRSHAGSGSMLAPYERELQHFAAMEGTNFTASRWDPVSGQPAYMFGVIDAPGGAGISAPDYTGAFGHM